MEPPPAAAPPPTAAAPTSAAYPDSVSSSPRYHNSDSWDESLYPSVATGGGVSKLRLMCSYGGHIVPRPHDKSLCYVGGDTRIVVVDRLTTLSDLTNRLSKTLLRSSSFSLKYQLPNEDLDSLISVTTDEDLENMIDEYERLNSNTSNSNNKSSRLRLFLFPSKPESGSSIGSLLENSTKSEDWFLDALNGATSGFSDSSSVNCLLGLNDDVSVPEKVKDSEEKRVSSGKNLGQDVHSVPDSPMLETTSSFGSASSSPSLANLPPIRVHVEDQKVGIEEQFSQMSVQQKQDVEVGFVGMNMSSPPAPTILNNIPAPAVVTGVPMSSPAVIAEYSNRVMSDDERSDQGIQMGYRKPTQQQPPPQPTLAPPQFQQKQTSGLEVPSPDSVSSDGSITNPLSRQKPMIYQDPLARVPSANSRATANPVDPNIPDPNTRIQMQQQIQDSGYLMPAQFELQNTQLHHQQQFIHGGAQYIHQHPSGAVPLASYYQVYPPQQQHPHHPALDQQNFVYYMPARQAQGYNMSLQQPSYSEASPAVPPTRGQTPPAPSVTYTAVRNDPAPKSELPASAYRTTSSAAPQFVQIPSSHHQPQYVGYSQIHHPSQSVAPASAATGNYGYEFADPTQGHMYYAQPLPPQSAAQYQTMISTLPEAGSHLTADNTMKQQVRTSQP